MQLTNGQLDTISFDKYKDFKFESVHKDGTLFEVDMRVAVKGFCPFCHRKLYFMRDKPLAFCKSKLHKRFVISKDKVRI